MDKFIYLCFRISIGHENSIFTYLLKILFVTDINIYLSSPKKEKISWYIEIKQQGNIVYGDVEYAFPRELYMHDDRQGFVSHRAYTK